MKQNKHKLLNIWCGSRSTRKFLVVVFAIIAVLMVDVAVSTVIDFFQPQISSNLGVIFFILVGLAFALGQYFVLSFVQERTKAIRSRSRSLQVIGVVTVVTQYALICFLVVSVLQMVLVASYSSVLLSASVTVTYALSITTLGVYHGIDRTGTPLFFCMAWLPL